MNYWLMKSEPEVFGLSHLQSRPKQTAPWDGVRNYQARNFMRDGMKVGDLAFFYHSSCKVPGVVGIVEIAEKAYPDDSQWNAQSPYFDADSKPDNPRWLMVDVRLVKALPCIITLESIRTLEPQFPHFPLLRRGNRLSIMPVEKAIWDAILKLQR